MMDAKTCQAFLLHSRLAMVMVLKAIQYALLEHPVSYSASTQTHKYTGMFTPMQMHTVAHNKACTQSHI